jgi:hypothetical protein
MFDWSLFDLLVFVVVAALWIVPTWRIFERTGHPGAYALLGLIPAAAIVLLWFLAFAKWSPQETTKAPSA